MEFKFLFYKNQPGSELQQEKDKGKKKEERGGVKEEKGSKRKV